jgi:pre-mRNA-processing factor 17
MELLQAYGEIEKDEDTDPPQTLSVRINSAPNVETSKVDRVVDFSKKEIHINPTYDVMWENPLQNVQGPWITNDIIPGQRNVLTGYVEDAFINDYSFESQHHKFQTTGKGFDPNSNLEINAKFENKKKRKKDELDGAKPSQATNVEGEIKEVTMVKHESDGDKDEENPVDDGNTTKKSKKIEYKATCIKHFKTDRDYQGRTWVDPPSHLKAGKEHDCYLPKKMAHNWVGHSKGVSVIRLAPEYGHLMLSGSHDATVKIWEVYDKKRCVQTWNAHEKGVKDANFSHDRNKVISCGYDKHTRIFDTETGDCIGDFTKRQTPYCCVFVPNDSNVFLVGQSDKKVIQWDMRTGKTVQEYDRHLGAVNTITFIDELNRFVTTSDDKSIRVWDYGMSAEQKYIAEPHMHAIAHVTKSYDGNWLLCQSADNQVIVYSIKDKFRVNRKKTFKGHNTAGYGVGVTLSPDGRWVGSGTSDGSLVFWDWKSTNIYKKMPAHSQVAVGVVWHPIEPSKVVSCSWDGTIKLWD